MEDIHFYDFPLDVGSHMQWCGTLEKTLLNSINHGMYSIQFFLGSPQSFNRTRVTTEDINKTQQLNQRFPTNIFSHAPYLYNLCGSKSSLAWATDDTQSNKTRHILSELEYELGVLANFTEKRNGVIVHPGNYTDREIGLETISKSINKINFPKNSKLLLENSAGQGTSLATTFEEIRKIIDNVNENNKKHIGVCIDTAHIFGYGSYDLSKINEVERMFTEFNKIIGIKWLDLIHFNDSSVKLGSKKDRHELIGNGYIWGEDLSSCIYLLGRCCKLGIPMVLETCPSDIKTIYSIFS